jgi:hypothetical protein
MDEKKHDNPAVPIGYVAVGEVSAPLKLAMKYFEAERLMLDLAVGVNDAFRYGLAVTLTPEELRERYPCHRRAEKTDDAEYEPYEAWTGVAHQGKP